MAFIKKLANKHRDNAEKAIEAHAGFVRFVASQVDKEGIREVLSSEKGDPIYYLKKAYDRLLNFAEQALLKQMPTKLEGTGEQGQIVIAYLPTVKKENG